MSDSVSISPYAYGSPEDEQFRKGEMRGFAIPLSHMPSGALANFLPDPHATGVQATVPGAITGAYSTADYLTGLVQRIAGTSQESVLHLPGGERAGELNQGSHNLAEAIIPPIQARNEAEQAAGDIGDLAGSLSVPFPGAVAARLPKVVSGVAHGLLPGPRAIAPAVGISGLLQQADPALGAEKGTSDNVGNPGLFDGIEPEKSSNAPATAQPGLFDGVEPDRPVTAQQPVAQGQPGLFDNVKPEPGLFDAVTQAEQDPSSITYRNVMYGAAAALGILFGGKRIVKFAGDLKADRFEKASGQVAAGTFPSDTAMPLPGTTDSPATRLRQSMQNDQAMREQYLRSTADTPLIADQLVAKSADITNPMAVTSRFQAEAVSGHMQGVVMPPLYEWYQKAAALSPDQLAKFNKGMNYGNEIDNRQANFNRMRSPGFLPTDPETRVNFKDTDLADLHVGLNDALSDPQVKELMDLRRSQTNAMANMLQVNGQVGAQQARDLKAAHLYYVPDADMENIVHNPMNVRNLTPASGSNDIKDVIRLSAQHDFALFKGIETNKANDLLISNAMKYQAQPLPSGVNPASMFKASKDVKGNWVPLDDGSSLAVRRQGELQHFEVGHRGLLDAIKGSPVQTGTALGAVNKLRQLSQSSMTGSISVLMGHIFPYILAARSAGEAAVLRPAGMYGSRLDRMVQRGSGGRLSLRGDPITPYTGTAYRAIVDPGVEVVKALGELFAKDAPNGINVRMRSMFGHSIADIISQRAISMYEMSHRAAMREQGLIGSAGATAKDLGPGNYMTDAGRSKAMMPLHDMVPELFMTNQLGGIGPTFVHLRNLFNDVRGAISESAHTNIFALNRDNPNITPEKLRHEVRAITGDPAVHGASRLANTYSRSVPFGNVAIQEGARVARSLNEEPVGTMLGYMFHYGSLAAATAYTASLAGPDAVRHLFDSLTDHERSSEANLYVPGQPTNPIHVPIQINMRAPFALMVQMFHDYLSMPSHVDDPNIADTVQNAFHDFFSKHVWQSTLNADVKGQSDAIPPIMPSGANAAITTLSGHSVEPTAYNAYMHADQPIPKMVGYDVTGLNNARTPGLSPGAVDPVTGTVNGGIMQHVFSDIFATAGLAMTQALKEGAHVYKGEQSLGDAIGNMMQSSKMRVIESIPGASLLWNQEGKEAVQTPLQQRVEHTLDVMRPTASFMSDAKNLGYTRKGGPELPVKPQGIVPTDPTMLELYATTGKYMQLLETNPKSPLKEVTDIRKELSSLNNAAMSPEGLRSLRNGYIEQMQKKYEDVMVVIHELNGELSTIVGRPVDVRSIQWSKGPEQFQSLTQAP